MLTDEVYHDYDAGLLNDFGGGNVNWWHDYLRAVIDAANENGQDQFDIVISDLRAARARIADLETELARWKRPEVIDWTVDEVTK